MGTALEVKPERAEQLEDRPAEGSQRRLIGRPGFGVGERLVDATAAAGGALDDPAIDEEQEHGRPLVQRGPRPEVRAGEIVLEMHPGVPGCLVEERLAVLVVVVRGVMGQSAGPVTSQLIHE